jgi:peptide/nickel transport system substrate-binding protein
MVGRARRTIAVAALAGLIAAGCSKKDDAETSSSAPADTAATTDAGGGDTTPEATTGGSDDTVAPDDTGTAAPDTEPASTEPAVAPQYGGTLVVSGESEVANPWTPAAMQCDAYCHQRARTFFDPIAAVGTDKLVHGVIADTISHNDDFTEWTITVRPGITFHDGTPVDAAAVVHNLQLAGQGLLISNALKDVAHLPDGSLKIDIVDPMTFTVYTGKNGNPDEPLPWPSFEYALTTQWALIASPTWLDAVAAGTADPAMPVGSGPFMVESYAPRDKLVVVRNPDYWQKDEDGNQLPYLDSIEFRVIEDPQTAEEALRANDIDMLTTGYASVISDFRNDPGDFTLTERDLYGNTNYLLIDLAKPGALQDARVRCALSKAIDRQELIDLIDDGILQVANGLFSPGQEGYLEDNGFDPAQDIEGAEALIDEYESETGEQVTVDYGTTVAQINAQTAELLKGYWAEIGVDMNIIQVPQDQFITDALFGSPDFHVFSWSNHSGVFIDEQFYWWHSHNSAPDGELALNFGRMEDPEVDAGLEEARSAPTAEGRQAAAEKVNRRFADQCFQIPISWGHTGTANDPNVLGVDNPVLPDGELALDYGVVSYTRVFVAG